MTLPPYLPEPDRESALATAGLLCHFIASYEPLAEQFARWVEHHPGDLDAATIITYLAMVHEILEPGCPLSVKYDPRWERRPS